MNRWIMAFLTAFLFAPATALGQERTQGTFFDRQNIPTTLVVADVTHRLASVDTVWIGPFSLGGSKDVAENQLQRMGDMVLGPKQRRYCRGTADIYPWAGKTAKESDLLNETVADRRANWVREQLGGCETLKSMIDQPAGVRGVYVLIATFEPVPKPVITAAVATTGIVEFYTDSIFTPVLLILECFDTTEAHVIAGITPDSLTISSKVRAEKEPGIYKVTAAPPVGYRRLVMLISVEAGRTTRHLLDFIPEPQPNIFTDVRFGFGAGANTLFVDGTDFTTIGVSATIAKGETWYLAGFLGLGPRQAPAGDILGERDIRTASIELAVFPNGGHWGLAIRGQATREVLRLEDEFLERAFCLGTGPRFRLFSNPYLIAGLDPQLCNISKFGEEKTRWRFGISPIIQFQYILPTGGSR